MALILHIETSSPVCSVCLARDGELIDYREDRQGNSHARILTVFIDELIKNNRLSYSDLDAIAVSAGPGSYTGLRIGVSTAKGLCYALGKPLIAIPTMLSLSGGLRQKANSQTGYYLPVVDARRMDIYTALFDAEGNEILPTFFVTVDKEFEQSLGKYPEIFVGGSAAVKCKEVLNTSKFHFIEDLDCDSRFMISLAKQKYVFKDFENLAYFEPAYLKEFGKKA